MKTTMKREGTCELRSLDKGTMFMMEHSDSLHVCVERTSLSYVCLDLATGYVLALLGSILVESKGKFAGCEEVRDPAVPWVQMLPVKTTFGELEVGERFRSHIWGEKRFTVLTVKSITNPGRYPNGGGYAEDENGCQGPHCNNEEVERVREDTPNRTTFGELAEGDIFAGGDLFEVVLASPRGGEGHASHLDTGTDVKFNHNSGVTRA